MLLIKTNLSSSIIFLCLFCTGLAMRNIQNLKPDQIEAIKVGQYNTAKAFYDQELGKLDEISQMIADFNYPAQNWAERFALWVQDLLIADSPQNYVQAAEEFQYSELSQLVGDLISHNTFNRLLAMKHSVQSTEHIANILISELFRAYNRAGEDEDMTAVYLDIMRSAVKKHLQAYKKAFYEKIVRGEKIKDAFQSPETMIDSMYKEMCPLISNDHLLTPLNLNYGVACGPYKEALEDVRNSILPIQQKAQTLYNFLENAPKNIGRIVKFILHKSNMDLIYDSSEQFNLLFQRADEILGTVFNLRMQGVRLFDQELVDLARQIQQWKREVYYSQSWFQLKDEFAQGYHNILMGFVQNFRHIDGVEPAAEVSLMLLQDPIGQPQAEIKAILRSDCLSNVLDNVTVKAQLELEKNSVYFLLRSAYCYSAFESLETLNLEQKNFLGEIIGYLTLDNKPYLDAFNAVRVNWEDNSAFKFAEHKDQLIAIVHNCITFISSMDVNSVTTETVFEALDLYLNDMFQASGHTKESSNNINFLFLFIKLLNGIHAPKQYELAELPKFLGEAASWTFFNAEFDRRRYSNLMDKVKERAVSLASTRLPATPNRGGFWDNVINSLNDQVDKFVTSKKSAMIENKWLSFILQSRKISQEQNLLLI